jgi:hypothetical protein
MTDPSPSGDDYVVVNDVLHSALMGATLTVRLDDRLAAALRRQARSSGRPQGEIVRQAVAAHLARSPHPSVMAKHFGTVRGPEDLSVGKAYRRAWAKRRA